MQFNTDFQQELENEKVQTLEAPKKAIDRSNPKLISNLTQEQLFGKEAVDGEIPTLTQDFIIEKSKQDKFIEMGQIAQEVFCTKKVSRKQVLAIESIAREITDNKEESKVIVDDHELNMFTEEPSTVEVDTVIENSRVAVDEITGKLKNSAKELAEKLLQTIDSDRAKRKDLLFTSISAFNESVTNFLCNTDKSSLEEVNLKFSRSLRWGDLMSVGLVGYYCNDDKDFERKISSFDGTYAETFLKDLLNFLQTSYNAFNVIKVFVSGCKTIVKNVANANLAISSNKEAETQDFMPTIGDLFAAFGSSKFNNFYTYLDTNIEQCYGCVKDIRESITKTTDIQELVKLTNELQHYHKQVMDCTANMAVINHVQYLVIKFLNNF